MYYLMKLKKGQRDLSGQAAPNYLLSASLILSAILVSLAFIFNDELKIKINDIKKNESSILNANQETAVSSADSKILEEKIIPSRGIELPVKWGDLGKQLVESGAIDAKKFEEIYNQRGGLNDNDKKMLYAKNGNVIISRDNSGVILNLFWALGLANKNPILENGPMMDKKYGGAGRFASTGGWVIAKGDAMSHYSKHQFIILSDEQQALVEKVSKNIYRPCCNNSTYFPDCNHGMAMLGLLELMASQGISESEMYRVALAVNSYWFPDTYLTIAKYFEKQGVSWDKIDAQKVLGFDYSSGSGYQNILSKIEPVQRSGGGGCGI